MNPDYHKQRLPLNVLDSAPYDIGEMYRRAAEDPANASQTPSAEASDPALQAEPQSLQEPNDRAKVAMRKAAYDPARTQWAMTLLGKTVHVGPADDRFSAVVTGLMVTDVMASDGLTDYALQLRVAWWDGRQRRETWVHWNEIDLKWEL